MAELIQFINRNLIQLTENGQRADRKITLDIENLVLMGAQIFESQVYQREFGALLELEEKALKAAQKYGADYVNCGYPKVTEVGDGYGIDDVRLEIVALFYFDKRPATYAGPN